MPETQKTRIVTLCRRVGQLYKAEQQRLQDLPDDERSTAIDAEDDKPDLLDLVIDQISDLTGIRREDAAEFVERVTKNGSWSEWKRANGETWPDISEIAQRIIDKDADGAISDSVTDAVKDQINEETLRTHSPTHRESRSEHTEPKPDDGNSPKIKGEALAIGFLVTNPEWMKTQIAEAVGCSYRTLFKWPQFIQADRILRSERNRFPKGTKNTSDGHIEAFEDTE